MSIRINPQKCVGCRMCIKYPKDCWGCVSCVKECKTGAIEFFLGEDMGGNDIYMQVEKDGKFLNWNFYNNNGLFRTITVDSANSNKY